LVHFGNRSREHAGRKSNFLDLACTHIMDAGPGYDGRLF